MDCGKRAEKYIVLQIANDYFGTKLYRSLFNALAEKEIRNIVFVPVKKGKSIEIDTIVKPATEEFIVSPCFNQLERLLFFRKQRRIISGIKETVNLKEIKVVHAHTLFSAGYAAMKLKEEYGIPYITAIRNTDVNLFLRKIRFLRKTGIDIMRGASAVVFLSPTYRDEVLNYYVPDEFRKSIQKKCMVIPNGISSFFLDNIYEDRKYDKDLIKLIYAGEINRNKNLEETVEAAKQLEKEGYNISFTVVGDITERGYDHILCNPMIRHIPRCEHEKLIKEYRNADIFVMPSFTETFGLVYAEAMSQGLPVIYTKGQGFDGQFEEGYIGFSVDPRKPEELAERIKRIVDNYETISKNCRRNCRTYTWTKIAEKYKDIYKRIEKNETN